MDHRRVALPQASLPVLTALLREFPGLGDPVPGFQVTGEKHVAALAVAEEVEAERVEAEQEEAEKTPVEWALVEQVTVVSAVTVKSNQRCKVGGKCCRVTHSMRYRNRGITLRYRFSGPRFLPWKWRCWWTVFLPKDEFRPPFHQRFTHHLRLAFACLPSPGCGRMGSRYWITIKTFRWGRWSKRVAPRRPKLL